MAPEIGEENGPSRMYSPILADKWSCGRVLAAFADIRGGNDRGLAAFARQLMNGDPHARPAILEWSESMDGHGSVALVPTKRRRDSDENE